MNTFVKSGEQDEDANSSSINRLPDEIILKILNIVLDLKTLCLCYMVSKRFSSIVLEVEAISFSAPLLNPNIPDNNNFGDVDSDGFPKRLFRLLINGVISKPLSFLRRMIITPSKPLSPIISSFYGPSFRSACTFFINFKGVKSLCIELPCSSHIGIDNPGLFKWKVNFGNRIKSFYLLSPKSISKPDEFHVNGNDNDEEDMELSDDRFRRNVNIAIRCLKDVILRHRMLLQFVKDLPMLEEVSIADSGRRGRLSLCGGKLGEVKKELVSSAMETVKSEMNRIEVPVSVSQFCVPVLDLPISGYVMKAITLVVIEMNGVQGGNDILMNSKDGFEDKEEAAYTEAVMEILQNHEVRTKVLL